LVEKEIESKCAGKIQEDEVYIDPSTISRKILNMNPTGQFGFIGGQRNAQKNIFF